MRIGLIDLDSKIPNLALMKVSQYYQDQKVNWYDPLQGRFDKVYCSKVFDFSSDYQYPIQAKKIYKGGSGHDLATTLPEEIENSKPDYQLYPDMDYAMGFTTRGCIRNCEFCVVPEKEGKLKVVNDIYDFWEGQEKIRLLDNNLTAHNEHFERVLNQIIEEELVADFNQGLDIRLITPRKAKLLSQVDVWGQIHFAFDNIEDEQSVKEGIKILENNGVKKYKLMFYVLIGFNSTKEEDFYRVNLLDQLGVDPFIMPYDKSDPYQQNFARWVNHKAIFNSVEWKEYRPNVKKETYQ